MTTFFVRNLVAFAALGCAPANHVSSAPVERTVRPIGATFGVPGPVLVQAASFRWRWVAACFASRDTNGDGSVQILIGRHGKVWGDETRLFLMLRGAPIEPIEQFLGSSPGKRLLAVVQRGHLGVHKRVNNKWMKVWGDPAAEAAARPAR